jgi:hypothetical protein
MNDKTNRNQHPHAPQDGLNQPWRRRGRGLADCKGCGWGWSRGWGVWDLPDHQNWKRDGGKCLDFARCPPPRHLTPNPHVSLFPDRALTNNALVLLRERVAGRSVFGRLLDRIRSRFGKRP